MAIKYDIPESNRQFFLYAKYHYNKPEQKRNIIHDVKILTAHRCGTLVKYIKLGDAIRVLLEIAVDVLLKTADEDIQFQNTKVCDLILSVSPENSWSTIGNVEYTYELATICSALRVLRFCKPLCDIGAIDENILKNMNQNREVNLGEPK